MKKVLLLILLTLICGCTNVKDNDVDNVFDNVNDDSFSDSSNEQIIDDKNVIVEESIINKKKNQLPKNNSRF